jgi:nicotinate dehydrogenase subunit A
MTMAITLNVNGATHQIDADPATPLLYVLRNDLALNGAKFGCGLGQCGSCMVMVEGEAVLSCVTPIMLLEGREITTVEGLGTIEEPGPVQAAFIEMQAAQCGYCIPGMMMSAQALLQKNPAPSDEDIRNALSTNLCRCGTHMRILAAIRRAGEVMQSAGLTSTNRRTG